MARFLAALAPLCAGLLFVAVVPTAAAQSAQISMSVSPQRVAVGEPFRLEVRVEVEGTTSVPEPSMPDLSPFHVMTRRIAPSMQFGFGMGRNVMRGGVVALYLLRAYEPGQYELAPASVAVGGQTYQSNPATVVVTDGTNGAASNMGRPDPFAGQTGFPSATGSNANASRSAPTGQLDGAEFDPRAFVRTVVDRTSAHVGEQLTVSLYLYLRGGLASAPVFSHEATTDGFWVHDLLPPSRTLEPEQQRVGRTDFNVFLLKRFAVFPLREGELQIGAPEVVLETGGPLDFFMGQPGGRLERAGVPVAIQVEPLPPPPPGPAPFVGSVSLQTSLDRDQVATGDAVTLSLQAFARGNLQALEISEFPRIDGLRVLQPRTEDRVVSPGDVVQGTRTTEWLVVPERPGEYTIPPFRVVLFDAESERYSVVESAALSLTAAGNAVAPQAPEPSERQDVEAGESVDELGGFGPIRTQSPLLRSHWSVADASWFYWALALIPTATFGLIGADLARGRLRAARPSDPAKLGMREAKNQLGEAREAAQSRKVADAYARASSSLKLGIESRLGETVGSLTHAQLKRTLVARGMSAELANELVEELEGYEFARFSAVGSDQAEMSAMLDRAAEFLRRLERFVPSAKETE